MSRKNELEGVIIQRGSIDDKECNLCGACVDVCPEDALFMGTAR
ncbi:4Fe-4S binding protein [Chloroflexota bacterium]